MQDKPEVHGELTQNKLLLLYALDLLGPVTGEQLLRFVVELDLMGYLDFALSLAELTDVHLLLLLDEEIGRVYHVTRRGGEMLEYFTLRILASKRDAIDKAISKWKPVFELEGLFRTEISPCPSGQFALHLHARTPDEPLIDITVYVSTHEQASSFSAAWGASAAQIYRAVLDALVTKVPSPSQAASEDRLHG